MIFNELIGYDQLILLTHIRCTYIGLKVLRNKLDYITVTGVDDRVNFGYGIVRAASAVRTHA